MGENIQKLLKPEEFLLFLKFDEDFHHGRGVARKYELLDDIENLILYLIELLECPGLTSDCEKIFKKS